MSALARLVGAWHKRRWLRVGVPAALLVIGCACIAAGVSQGRDTAVAGAGLQVSDIEVQQAYAATAQLAPKGGFRVRGTIAVKPDKTDAGNSIVQVTLDNPYPELARFHADIREGTCTRTVWGRDGRTQYELEPIDDGVSSRTVLNVPASSVTTASYVAILLGVDDTTVYACGELLPNDPVLAASAQQVTSFERSCDAYLDDLNKRQLAVLDPLELPEGACREQARTRIAGADRRELQVVDYGPGEARRLMNALRDCLVDEGLDVPPVEVDERGVAMVLTGLARRDSDWGRISANCDRQHPLPRASHGVAPRP